ncbi:uncharacterized protein LOC142597613 [Dermatophagoides farinae]|uniref:Uncharacterized protein n=1 Tax=Dermatophagoides farinae TaxID=6954 RepID=A0A922L1Q1_DERFA|nr:hypothetical protein DERF_014897 [Dermatophagoides farinae]
MSKLASFWFWEIRFLLLLLLYVPIAKLQHDTSLSFNNVCITNSDCQSLSNHSNETELNVNNVVVVDDDDDDDLLLSLPLFCLDKSQCLCNRLQTSSNKPFYTIDGQCIDCNFEIIKLNGHFIDPCVEQDPYSQCNETNGQCECLTEDQINQSLFDYQDDGHSDQNHRKQSVCFHHLIERKFETFINSTHQTMMNWTQVGSDQTKSFDWILATIFAYILPFISITVFLYFIYRSLYRPDEDRDSEMILYQAL